MSMADGVEQKPVAHELLAEVRALRADVARLQLAMDAVTSQSRGVSRLLERLQPSGEALVLISPER